jgi:protein-S-isoprenylcysteine O-methyltransferase Ste14
MEKDMAMTFKPGKNLFYIVLGALALILIALGVFHSQLEQVFSQNLVEKNIPDFIMFAAIGVLLWNRKILGDEKKAAAARMKEEEEAAAAKVAEVADTEEGESGTDAPD